MNLRFFTRTAILLALTLAFQMLKLPQPMTGPAINAMLFVSTAAVGVWGGVIIGALTPWIAFINGILNPALSPAIPFIMLGNAVLCIIFGLVKKINIYFAVAGAAAFKFIILSTAVRFVVNVPPPAAKALQIPQLYTALVGGAVALVVIKILEKPLNLR
jgi:hypothetical protein